MKEKKYIVYLHSCWLSQQELLSVFAEEASPKNFFNNLSDRTLRSYIPNFSRRSEILKRREKIDTDKLDKIIHDLNLTLITLEEDSYPESLTNIPHTPFLLYVRGSIPKWDMFWVVGSRSITNYWKKIIQKIVPDIAKIFPIVSGGAAWCDSQAHKVSIETWGKTVVVVGTGIDQTYPVGNEKLFDMVVDKGWAIISIFRIGEPGNPYNFPVRNEVVVWISKGILVIEAKQKSGSLITAWLCLDLGRDLFAIPWDILLSSSVWTNTLIKKWEAKCVIHSEDILEEYDILMKQSLHKEQLPLLGDIESKIYNYIVREDSDIDTLSSELGEAAADIMTNLSLLELKKLVKKDISGNYSLI